MASRRPNLIERVGLALAGSYVREALGENIDPDDAQYRRITDARRDLSPYATERAQEVSIHLWRTNPMAHRLIEMVADFVIGADGVQITAAEDDVQEVIDEFWDDPVMRLNDRFRDIVRDLCVMGEMCFNRNVNPTSGRMRLGIIDTARIKDVKPDLDNLMVDKEVLIRQTMSQPEKSLAVINLDDTTDPANPKYVGDVFYFAINRVMGEHRGVPDLFTIADWVDGYDQLLFNALERSALVNAFVYDVTIEGADEPQITKWQLQNAAPPRPGSVRVHNEREKWDAIAPSLGSTDVVTIGRAVKNMGLGGAGVPEAWFAEGDSANRATLAAQGDPTYRMLQSRQKEIKAMIERIITVVLQEAVTASRLSTSISLDFDVVLPELSAKDTATLAAAVPQVATALTAAIAEKMISRKSSRTLFLALASQLGVELDAQAEEDQIAQEEADAQAAQEEALKKAQDAYVKAANQMDGQQPNQPNGQPGQPVANGPQPASAAPQQPFAPKVASTSTPTPPAGA